ncbi:RraA family protein [Microbacterium sulfonylureivorans]|uniref:RraA family protein n=1 Tax=Microbacterium sulfonylureivorans TaxID=2486854 RepID=UPI000FDA6785|nr:RraA family protein [Microbacterium sulfonylureivorans]
MIPTNDVDRFRFVRDELYTPVIGDILDVLGRQHQFLSAGIRPIEPAMLLVGRAMPVLIADVFGVQEQPFGRLTEALDALQPGEIYLARSARLECSAWGEILTATARGRGAAGAVIDGFHRDTRRVLEQDWPVFSRGSFAQDAGVRATVVDYRVSLEIDGVEVHPGDLIVGDIDGVVVVPRAIEDEVLELAAEKVAGESITRRAIDGGMSSSDALARYGVL